MQEISVSIGLELRRYHGQLNRALREDARLLRVLIVYFIFAAGPSRGIFYPASWANETYDGANKQ